MDVWIITQESDYGYDGSSTIVLGWTDDPAEAMGLVATDLDVPLDAEWKIATSSERVENLFGRLQFVTVEIDGFDLYFVPPRTYVDASGLVARNYSEGETISIYRFPGKYS